MGQYWTVFNLDDEWRMPHSDKLGCFFNSAPYNVPFPILDFTIPSWSEECLTRYTAKFPRVVHRSTSPLSSFTKLPVELISMVFKHLADDIHALICLSLVDGVFFDIGFASIIEAHKLQRASWARDRVICLGDYTRDDDLPPSLEKYASNLIKKFNEEKVTDEDYGSQKLFYSAVSNNFREAYSFGIKLRRLEFLRMLGRDQDAYRELLCSEYESRYPWVLCNLSKREYVRVEAIAEITGSSCMGPSILGPINLGHALLSQICWSHDDSIAMPYDGDLHRGAWAGDRFEVTTADMLKPSEQWQDKSELVAKTLIEIWMAQGDDAVLKEAYTNANA